MTPDIMDKTSTEEQIEEIADRIQEVLMGMGPFIEINFRKVESTGLVIFQLGNWYRVSAAEKSVTISLVILPCFSGCLSDGSLN